MAFNMHEVALKVEKITMPQKGFDESSLGTSWSSEPSSSGLNTPFGSELGSTETEREDEDFMAELTRQMANYMLEADDDDDESRNPNSPNSFSENTEACGSPAMWCGCNSTSIYYCDQRFMSTSTEPAELSTPFNSTGIYSSQTLAEGQMQPIEVYQLKNQPAVKEPGYSCLGRQAEMTEAAKQFNPQQLQQKGQNYRENSGRGHGGKSLASQKGSGMRAIFLGGSGSRNGSCGTGVFLPRVVENQTELKNKPGCSTVLIPAKVLQALELHFNNIDALSQSNGCGGYTNHNRQGGISQQKRNPQVQTKPESNHQEMLLPEEWTY